MTNSNKILAVVRPNRPKPDDIKQSEAKTEPQTDSEAISSSDSQTESKSPEESSDSKNLSKPSTLDKPSRRPQPFSSSDKPSRPSRPRPRVLEEVPQATNLAGETFNPGDRIWVRSPWGKWAVAEIDKFYQCSPDEIVAHFLPKEEREGWTWMGGCIRSQLLKKVPTPQA
ncbi:MAG: hypothetical protein SWJ54_09945 [Cyanobacteriota bacterium]|nr:hypothetical protein [Cyanobacteriota bacterium]